MAVAIIGGPLVAASLTHVVGRPGLLELGLSIGITRISVRMILHCQAPERLLDHVSAEASRENTEYFVIVTLSHVGSLRFAARARPIHAGTRTPGFALSGLRACLIGSEYRPTRRPWRVVTRHVFLSSTSSNSASTTSSEAPDSLPPPGWAPPASPSCRTARRPWHRPARRVCRRPPPVSGWPPRSHPRIIALDGFAGLLDGGLDRGTFIGLLRWNAPGRRPGCARRPVRGTSCPRRHAPRRP
jgi:hypothetical protein